MMDRCVRSARIIEVIETTENRGNGDDDSPIREVIAYWLPDGTKIGEFDPVSDE